MCEEPKLLKVEYYTVNDRPVKLVSTFDGGRKVLVMNLHTGEFESDISYLSRCYNPEQDVDSLSATMFEQYVSEIRKKIIYNQC